MFDGETRCTAFISNLFTSRCSYAVVCYLFINFFIVVVVVNKEKRFAPLMYCVNRWTWGIYVIFFYFKHIRNNCVTSIKFLFVLINSIKLSVISVQTENIERIKHWPASELSSHTIQCPLNMSRRWYIHCDHAVLASYSTMVWYQMLEYSAVKNDKR